MEFKEGKVDSLFNKWCWKNWMYVYTQLLEKAMLACYMSWGETVKIQTSMTKPRRF